MNELQRQPQRRDRNRDFARLVDRSLGTAAVVLIWGGAVLGLVSLILLIGQAVGGLL